MAPKCSGIKSWSSMVSQFPLYAAVNSSKFFYGCHKRLQRWLQLSVNVHLLRLQYEPLRGVWCHQELVMMDWSVLRCLELPTRILPASSLLPHCVWVFHACSFPSALRSRVRDPPGGGACWASSRCGDSSIAAVSTFFASFRWLGVGELRIRFVRLRVHLCPILYILTRLSEALARHLRYQQCSWSLRLGLRGSVFRE